MTTANISLNEPAIRLQPEDQHPVLSVAQVFLSIS